MDNLNGTDVNSNEQSRATWFIHDRDSLRWDDPNDLATLRTTSFEQRLQDHAAIVDQLIRDTLGPEREELMVQHMNRRAEDPTFGTGDTVRIRKPRNADEHRRTEPEAKPGKYAYREQFADLSDPHSPQRWGFAA